MNERKGNILLWVEKYRPKTVNDVILPKRIKRDFEAFVKTKDIPNLLLSGSAGVGKTTVAKALCEELEYDYLMINGSLHGNIDTLRNRIQTFASTVSMGGQKKCVILDEADQISHQTQMGLRGFIEEFHKNCRFIFTCNFPKKILEPIHSRCTVFSFDFRKGEKKEVLTELFSRVKEILKTEDVGVKDYKIVVELIGKRFPDMRRLLNDLQRYSKSGSIDEGILLDDIDVDMKSLAKALISRQYKDISQWAEETYSKASGSVYSDIFKALEREGLLKTSSIPQAVLIANDFDRHHSFVADGALHLKAFLVTLMVECEFEK